MNMAPSWMARYMQATDYVTLMALELGLITACVWNVTTGEWEEKT